MTWIFLGLLVPLAVGLVVMLDGEKEEMSQKRGVTTTQAATQATTRAVTQERGHVAEVLAVGDGRTMWVVHPTVMKTIGGGKILPGYELFATTNGGATWGAIRNKDGLGFFSDYATALALVGRPKGGGSKGSTSACVFSGHNGTVRAVNLSGEVQLMRPLPRGEVLLAAMGSQDGVFALTLGEWGSGREGEGERRREVRLYGLQGEWKMLAEMQGEKGEMPGPGAKVGMAPCGRRVIAMWVEADRLRRGEELVTRGLDYHVKGAAWSKAVRTELAEVGGGGGSGWWPGWWGGRWIFFGGGRGEFGKWQGGGWGTTGG
ncbi:MAG: hypothetical protein FWD61_14645, partial [Phycisphaerales bacterium]|nr:hypothetical protein [Phycisphaerales bacterium]